MGLVSGDGGGFEGGGGYLSFPLDSGWIDGDEVPEDFAGDEGLLAESWGPFGLQDGLPVRSEPELGVPEVAHSGVAGAGQGFCGRAFGIGGHHRLPDEEGLHVALRQLLQDGLDCRGPLQTGASSGGEEGDDAGFVDGGVERGAELGEVS